MDWKLAPSNEANGWKIIGDAFVENGKNYINAERYCSRCGGKGQIPYYGHIDQGVCFKCSGSGGREVKRFRAYSPDERAEMDAAAEQRRNDKLEHEREEAQARIAVWFTENGYDPEHKIFFPVGCNTYNIKDYLKEHGARYSDAGWFVTLKDVEDIELPEGGFFYETVFENMFNWANNGKFFRVKEGAIDNMKNEVKQAIAALNKKTSVSEWYGEIGDRIRKEEATFVSAKAVSSEWGDSILYTFKIGENLFTWFTQSVLDPAIKPGNKIILSGTVKKHTEYNGVLQTQLSRCIIKEA